MTGDTEAGIRWLESTAPGWAPGSTFAFHNFWHLALYRLDRGDAADALAIYDARIAPVSARRSNSSMPRRCCGGSIRSDTMSAAAGRRWRNAGASASIIVFMPSTIGTR
jgi:hypothetical protein